MTHLCPIQQKWFVLHPTEATLTLEQLSNTITQLRNVNQWAHAKWYLLRAKEVVEILFEIERFQISSVPFRFTHINLSLADTMQRLGEHDQAVEVLNQTKHTLVSAVDEEGYLEPVKSRLQRCLNIVEKWRVLFSQSTIPLV